MVVANGYASPFQQVLAWLAKRNDFFSAASIALDLLQDGECLFHLWENADLIGGDFGDSQLDGLLDGIVPIDNVRKSQSVSQYTITIAHLADMTIGCLIKGGVAMSNTLRKFLQKNKSYDPARASLMLAATTACALSHDPSAMESVIGGPNVSSMVDEVVYEDLLWPVQCLLDLGTARSYLENVLLLLNATIPDELRHKNNRPVESPITEFVGISPPITIDIELTKALVGLILASDSSAIEMLLDLEVGEPRHRYWQSLDHGTQLTLSLLEVDDAFPMLRHPEVRTWVREELNMGIQVSANSNKAQEESTLGMLPTIWLQRLCMAILKNGGCDLTDFEIEDIIEVESETALFGSSTSNLITESSLLDDGLTKHRLEILETRNALIPKHFQQAYDSTPAYSVDFDLIVPSLLLLQTRGSPWLFEDSNTVPAHTKKYANTAIVLDAACYLAGRRATFEASMILTTTKKNDHEDCEPNLFASFDRKTAMRQCFLSNNVSAGASLIGGKNGFILHICDVLMQELNISMADAESFILDDHLRIRIVEKSHLERSSFILSSAHRKLLWLLDEHVLSIKTFGEFETVHIRGRVDPVFASRSIFRAWFAVCYGDYQTASKWLCAWLGRRLEICTKATTLLPIRREDGSAMNNEDGRNCTDAKHRLACAALARSLIWSCGGEIDSTTSVPRTLTGGITETQYVPLASKMEFDKNLLIGICQCCIGLVESVPSDTVEGLVETQVFQRRTSCPDGQSFVHIANAL